MLKALNVPIGHFSHIVVDEAAQAEEPLVMIPIMTFSGASTNIVLAGDLNQLGPVIKSPTASKAGLGMGYLQRLMLMGEVYGLDTRVGETIVDLRRNYRSHDAIIAFSNQSFYGNTIRDYGNAYITYHLVLSGVLPKKGFPVVFHGVDSSEEHKESPSLSVEFREALTIRNYCVELTRDRLRKICGCKAILVASLLLFTLQ
ncbi:P-loop containing nucleoside triphosphate hydrolase protein [Russula dissimulans]|nr:P-loop containing nucleoside triphosphate hydrolase protein [Russula dissimulans]